MDRQRKIQSLTENATTSMRSGAVCRFAGYAVAIRYYVVAEPEPRTYRIVEDRVVLVGTEPSFVFTLLDAHQLGLEQELHVA